MDLYMALRVCFFHVSISDNAFNLQVEFVPFFLSNAPSVKFKFKTPSMRITASFTFPSGFQLHPS